NRLIFLTFWSPTRHCRVLHRWPTGAPEMADTRYLKQRRQGWYFVMRVPADVQEAAGKTVITKTLGTRDLTKAQKDRWKMVADWTDHFETLRGNKQWTAAEAEEKAEQEFDETLRWLDDLDQKADDLSTFIDIEAEK